MEVRRFQQSAHLHVEHRSEPAFICNRSRLIHAAVMFERTSHRCMPVFASSYSYGKHICLVLYVDHDTWIYASHLAHIIQCCLHNPAASLSWISNERAASLSLSGLRFRGRLPCGPQSVLCLRALSYVSAAPYPASTQCGVTRFPAAANPAPRTTHYSVIAEYRVATTA